MKKIALCSKRNLPPVKRQDGPSFLPTEALYDLVATIALISETDVIIHNEDCFVKTDQKYGEDILYVKSTLYHTNEIGKKDTKKTLDTIIRELQFFARRYATGRTSVACSIVNECTESLLSLGYKLSPDTANSSGGTIWAYDGDKICCNAKFYEEKYGKDGKKAQPE